MSKRIPLTALAVAAGLLGTAEGAQAAQVGQLCMPKSTSYIYNAYPLGYAYWVSRPTLIRIDGFNGSSEYFGHSSGEGKGQLSRASIDQDSCRW